MTPPMFEVLLRTEWQSRHGPADRWFVVGAFPSRSGACATFRELCAEQPDSRVTIVLVQSSADPETGLFHDRILEARGRAPLIDRSDLAPYSPEVKAQLLRGEAWPSPQQPQPETRGRSRTPVALMVLGGCGLGLVAIVSVLL